MNKKEKMEFYTVKPNLNQIYGKKIDDETTFDEWTEDKTVHQILKNRVLTTIISKEYEVDKIKVKEYSKTEVEYPKGTILIWNEKIGYILPNLQVCTLEEVEEDVKNIRNIYSEINPGE